MCLGLGNGYIEPKEEKVSLLKPYTNNDRINDMSVEEKAKRLDEFVDGDCDICPFSTMKGDVQDCLLLDYKPTTCRRKYEMWLESEAEG